MSYDEGRMNEVQRDVHTLNHRVTKLEEWPPRVVSIESAIAQMGSESRALRETVNSAREEYNRTRQTVEQIKIEQATGFSQLRGALYVMMVAIPALVGVIAGAYKVFGG